MKYYLKALKLAADFKGRASKREFWMFILCNVLITIGIAIFSKLVTTYIYNDIIYQLADKLSTIYAFVIAIPGMSIAFRRLHDIGKSGGYYFFGLIPVVGLIILIYWWCLDGEKQANQWGAVIEDDTQLISTQKTNQKSAAYSQTNTNLNESSREDIKQEFRNFTTAAQSDVTESSQATKHSETPNRISVIKDGEIFICPFCKKQLQAGAIRYLYPIKEELRVGLELEDDDIIGFCSIDCCKNYMEGDNDEYAKKLSKFEKLFNIADKAEEKVKTWGEKTEGIHQVAEKTSNILDWLWLIIFGVIALLLFAATYYLDNMS